MDLLEISILYVEDSAIIRNSGAEIIRKKTKNVYLAEDGLIGLDLFKKYQPEIVITDIGMPNMDGLDMSRQIKKINPETKIIITTAHDDSKYLMNSIEIGIDQYLLKSEIRTQLSLSINKWYDIIINERKSKAATDFKLILSKTILEEAPNLVLVTNAQGYIEFVNEYYMRITGYCAEEVFGMNPRFQKSGKMNPTFYQELWEHITAGKKWEGTFINKRKNGTLYKEIATIFPIRVYDENISHYVKISVNIAEIDDSTETIDSNLVQETVTESQMAGNFFAIKYENQEELQKIQDALIFLQTNKNRSLNINIS